MANLEGNKVNIFIYLSAFSRYIDENCGSGITLIQEEAFTFGFITKTKQNSCDLI